MNSFKFKIPGRDESGFLKRTRRAMEFFEMQGSKESSIAKLDEMVEFLAGFVTEPKSKKAAKEVLWNATEEQYTELLNAALGRKEEEDTVTPGEEGSSDGG